MKDKPTREMTVLAYAKINLSLGVGPRRDDGYHPVEMVMCSVDCHDTVTVTSREKGVTLVTDLSCLPSDSRNIAHRAASAFLSAAGIPGGLYIRIRKKIPVAAGLAGGSADAAAVLWGLQRLFGSPLSDEKLVSLAAQLGSDVPFCLKGGLALATGRGTELTYLPPFPGGPAFVLVNPGVPLATAGVYRRFDAMDPSPWPETQSLIRAVASKDWPAAASRFCNMLEPAAFSLCPAICSIRDALLANGAMAARMSGSGPTVYGFFPDRSAALLAADRLGEIYPFVRIASPVSSGIVNSEGKTPFTENTN